MRKSNYINGSLHMPENPKMFESRNPANPYEVLGLFPNSDDREIDMAVEAAKRAFPEWQKMGMVKRAEYLWRVARMLEDNIEHLSQLVAKESGKQINEARADVVEAFHMAQYGFSKGFIGEAGKVLEDEIRDKFCMETYEPRGVVVSITPWNFPIAISFWLTALPLIYGNTVILKPSEETPLCAYEVAKLFHLAQIPRGVFQVVHGKGKTGWKLANHPDTNVVLFTGSYEVGKRIKKAVAGFDNKICTIETGSKSGIIVLEDANMEDALQASLASAFKTAGQRCVSGSRIIVERKIYREFTEKFVELARRIKTGDPFDPETYYGPMINKAGVEKGKFYNQVARAEGFKILLDRTNETPPSKNGYWLRPFVYTGEWRRTSRCLTEEAFSPHVAIIPANDWEDAIRIYNDTDYGLACSVFTDNIQKAMMTLRRVKCGITYHNLPCIGAGVRLPFGGVKKSGNLISSAAGLLPAITHTKAVTLNLGEKIAMAQGLDIDIKK